MSIRFHNIALVGKYESAEVTEPVLAIAAFLRSRGATVWIEQGTASSIGGAGDFPVASYDEIGSQADLAIVVGGDGTMLNAARRLASHNVPLTGVNLGRLGFLTDIPGKEAIERLGDILDGAFTEEPRFMLAAEVTRADERVFQTVVFNDVVLNRGDLGRMIEFELFIDGEFVYTLRADGMIVSTPTGSTAYAMSANGPILHPTVGGIAVVPLCPHALTARPITLPDCSKIEIVLSPPHDARVHFDGQTSFDVHAGDVLNVTRAPVSVRILHPESYSYYAMLRGRLHWSETPRRP